MIRRHWPIALVTALAAAGCVTPGQPKPAPTPGAEGVLKAQPVATATLTGVVMAPAGVISAGGANVISAGGGNVISAGGANVVSAGGLNWRTLAISETPLAGVEVYLADAAGQPVAKLPRVRTDAQGRYRLARVPVGFTFKVVALAGTADGKAVSLQTIAKPTAPGDAEVGVSAATTMVAETVAEGREGLLGTFNPATFAEAVAETKANMTDAERPADWSDRAAIRTQMRKLARRLARVQQAVDELQVDLARATTRASDLEAALATLHQVSPEPGMSPRASATPAGTGSPTVTRSAAPSPSPIAVTVVASAAAGLVGARQLAFDPRGTLYVADQVGDRLRVLDAATGTFTSHLDARTGLFLGVHGVAFDAQGNLYASVRGGRDKILKISPDGRSATLAGGTAGYADGPGADARFNQPSGLAIDAAGNLYVADMGNHCIRVVAPDGQVRTLAGKAEPGAADGPAADARFNSPLAVALDARGGVFVADTGNHRIRKITAEGQVKTLAGSDRGLRDGPALRAAFDRPVGLLAEAGHLLVADSGNGRVRRLALTTDEVTTLPLGDGLGAPYGLAKDARGRVWVSDSATHRVMRFEPLEQP